MIETQGIENVYDTLSGTVWIFFISILGAAIRVFWKDCINLAKEFINNVDTLGVFIIYKAKDKK